ncbi:MAG: GntR family transcriptional regulator [Cetobacterium sp.]
MEILKRKKDETAKEHAYRTLKEKIMNLELEPGQSISESEIAEWFSLSRTPVREILMKLKDEHLIEVIPQKGTYVSLINLDLVREGTFVRSVLESEVLKLACNGIEDDFKKKLDMNIFQYEYIVDEENSKAEKHHLDKRFHEIIFDSVGMSNIWESIQKLSTHYNRVRVLSEIQSTDRHILEEHKRIIEIITNKEYDKVEEIIETHIKKPMDKWKKLYADGSEFKRYFNI